MAGYWLKLYTETLDDIKYYKLSDNGKLALFELLMVAKRVDQQGVLPPLDEIIFLTHGSRSEEWWKSAIAELEKINFLVTGNGSEKIRKFEERQSKIDDADRQREYRKKKHNGEFSNENEQEKEITCHEPVTNLSRNVTEKEREKEIKKERETEREKERNDDTSPSASASDAWIKALGDLQSHVPSVQYETYLAQLQLEQVHNSRDKPIFVVKALTTPTAELVRKRYGQTLAYAIQGYYGKPVELQIVS